MRRRILGVRRGVRGGRRGCGPCLFLQSDRWRRFEAFPSAALWMDGIHKARSWLRSVMCAHKPRVRFETTSSAVVLSRRPFRKWSMELRFSRLASLTWLRLFFPRMGRLAGDVSPNSRWSVPFQVEDIVLLYAFLRATSKNGTSFKTACARPMFQR